MIDPNIRQNVFFFSWPEKTGSGMRLGKLHVLDCKGNPVYEQDLPLPKSSSHHINGALPAPTIANIDADPDYELILNTINAGFVAYDLPGSSNAEIYWQSGRNRGFAKSPGRSWHMLFPILHLLLQKP